MTSKIILWDFDGTLAYREGMWGATLIEILQDEEPDLWVNRDELRPHLQSGFPWHTPETPHPAIRDATTWWRMLMPVFKRAFAAQGLSASRASELAARVPSQFCSPAKWKMFEDTVPTLSSLARRGWTHVILSNHVPELPAIVDALGISCLFSAIYTSALTGYEKPHEEAFRIALRALPVPADVWMVGDNPDADVRGAQQLGIPAILVRKSEPGIRHQCGDLSGAARLIENTQPADAGSS